MKLINFSNQKKQKQAETFYTSFEITYQLAMAKSAISSPIKTL